MTATQTLSVRRFESAIRTCAIGAVVVAGMMIAACSPPNRFERDAVEEFADLDIVRAEDTGTPSDAPQRPDVQDAGGPTPDGGTLPVEVAAGGAFTCGRSGIGTVRCWGQNQAGQLGDGSMMSPRLIPGAEAGPLNDVAQIATGDTHACARTNAGLVYCWGSNTFGELGNGTAGSRSRPTRVSFGGGTGAAQIVAGFAHACARLTDGSIRCWGANMYAQCGNNSPAMSVMLPVRVAGISNAVYIAAGGLHTCAILGDGTVRCWGSNTHGQLGDGTVMLGLAPVTASGLSGVASIATGSTHTCAVSTDNSVRCWGLNDSGQLGIGSMADAHTPTPVNGLQARSITTGGTHTCAVTMTNEAFCWGANGVGQVGDGTMAARLVPTLLGVPGVLQLSAGASHTCAVLGDGTISCWGRNAMGQLGNGMMNDVNIAVSAMW